MIAKESLRHVVLSTHKSEAPPKYRVAREAELTVVIYENQQSVSANFVLDTVDLNADRTNDILKSLTRVVR